LLLMFLVIAFGLTGYLLPWDQKGYWATRVATDIAATTPLVGKQLQYLIQGGNEYGNLTLTRFYAIHVVILPALLVCLLVAHVALFRKAGGVTPSWRLTDGRADARGARWILVGVIAAFLFIGGLATSALVSFRAALAIACLGAALPIGIELLRSKGLVSTKDDPRVVGEFWPDQLARNALFALGIVGLLAALSAYRRVPLDAPADPMLTYLPRPDWYFLSLFQLLKYFEGHLIVVGTLVVPGLATLILFALPLLDRGPSRSPLSRSRAPLVAVVYGLVAGVFLLTYLAIRADERNPEVQRLRREADRAASRAAELAENGIPPE